MESRSKIKTGDVYQIRKSGRNYIAIGKAKDNAGNVYICSVLNGNVNPDGTMKVYTNRKPSIHFHKARNVYRVHSTREVDYGTFVSANPKMVKLVRPMAQNTGVEIVSPNIPYQLKNLFKIVS